MTIIDRFRLDGRTALVDGVADRALAGRTRWHWQKPGPMWRSWTSFRHRERRGRGDSRTWSGLACHSADVTLIADVNAMVESVVKAWNKLDIRRQQRRRGRLGKR